MESPNDLLGEQLFVLSFKSLECDLVIIPTRDLSGKMLTIFKEETFIFSIVINISYNGLLLNWL